MHLHKPELHKIQAKAEQIPLFYHIVDLDGRKIAGGDTHSGLADLLGGEPIFGVHMPNERTPDYKIQAEEQLRAE